jgi:hypothetical protein
MMAWPGLEVGGWTHIMEPGSQGLLGGQSHQHCLLCPSLPIQVQPDVDNLEPSSGGPGQWGRLLLLLEYDFGSQEVRVTWQAKRLCG